MRDRLEVIVVSVIVAITVVTGAQTIVRSAQLNALANRPKPPPVPCIGEPIYLNEEYGGGPVKPWTCKVQCDDQKQRYIVYTNDYATQCAPLPNCTDDGEDRGITCTLKSEAETSSK